LIEKSAVPKGTNPHFLKSVKILFSAIDLTISVAAYLSSDSPQLLSYKRGAFQLLLSFGFANSSGFIN
jgi:hypothetical protein